MYITGLYKMPNSQDAFRCHPDDQQRRLTLSLLGASEVLDQGEVLKLLDKGTLPRILRFVYVKLQLARVTLGTMKQDDAEHGVADTVRVNSSRKNALGALQYSFGILPVNFLIICSYIVIKYLITSWDVGSL